MSKKTAHLKFDEDIVELDHNLTEEEINEELYG